MFDAFEGKKQRVCLVTIFENIDNFILVLYKYKFSIFVIFIFFRKKTKHTLYILFIYQKKNDFKKM